MYTILMSRNKSPHVKQFNEILINSKSIWNPEKKFFENEIFIT